MSQDIRSFYKVVPKKHDAVVSSKPKKRAVIISSDDEDVIPNTPTPKKKDTKPKKRKASDSDDQNQKSAKKKPKGENLKPVSAADLFGSAPIKQSAVVKKTTKDKKSVKDENFEKCLMQLDEDFPVDFVDLDKTIEESLNHSEVVKNGMDKTPKKAANVEKKTPKRKQVEELNESGMDPDQERYERKRHSFAQYQKYLHRGAPPNKGQKELPQGKPDCLKGLCFLRTGVLDSLERDDFDAIIKEHGGRTVSGISRKVNYLVAGDEPGESKMDKAKGLSIKIINEDELLDLILTKSGMKAKYAVEKDEEEAVKERKKSPVKEIKIEKKSPVKNGDSSKPNLKKLAEKKTSKVEIKKEIKPETTPPKGVPTKLVHAEDLKPIERKKLTVADTEKSWTEKYKPAGIKSIIGQQGDKSNMNKLLTWLQNWHKHHGGKSNTKLTKPSPWAKNDDGAYFKCALLSGSPGIGKTTTATLVAKELGFDIVEFNASDTRSKRLLHEEVSQLLSSTSLTSYFKDGSAPTRKHVLLMDEVDGMAGNEDRGGMQELINLIKSSSVPIICMCNDRQHAKIRSLGNYCFDLRFIKPKPEQIKGMMMSICCKEGLKISSDALMEIIKGAGMDIRQTLNNLSMWTASEKSLSAAKAQKESESAQKDTVLGPWEVIRKVFSEEDQKGMSIADRSKLFFYDYSIGPLFVQENYLQVVPHCPKEKLLERVAAAADCISMGDIIEKKIRSTNNWALLESQGMYSSVLPGHYMKGHFGGQINFPGWLGKNSKRNKFQRLQSELQAHMRTSITGSKVSVNLDYIYHLRNNIVRPLAKEGTAGIPESLEVMRAYHLLREDLDSVLELSQWPKQKDPMAMVESKVKSAFTRAYNKEGPALPYATNNAAVKKRAVASMDEATAGSLAEEDEAESDNDEDDITKDAMIKEKKKPAAKGKKEDAAAGTSKKPAASSRGKTKKPK